MSRWRHHFEETYPTVVQAGDLVYPAARAMAALLSSGRYGGGKLTQCRGGNVESPSANLLILDVAVELGQRPAVNDIRAIETVAVAFIQTGAVPLIYPLRDGFPRDVPHMNLAASQSPQSLCLFEMPSEEILRIATPFLLLERVRFWMRETAYGRLHGEDQPIDPLFMQSAQAVVLPPLDGREPGVRSYRGYRTSDHPGCPAFLEPVRTGAPRPNTGTFAAMMLTTRPLRHARIRMLPFNVAELLATFCELGIDLLEPLRAEFLRWLDEPDLKAMLQRSCLIVVNTPIERSAGILGVEVAKAFITQCTGQELADKLGVFWVVDGHVGKPLTMSPPDVGELEKLLLLPVDVHRPLDRHTAQVLSGLDLAHDHATPITLIGCGALGSQIALTAARMGIGVWTTVDPDHLLPHNVARHGLLVRSLGMAKAEAVASEITSLLGPGAATYVFGRIEDGENGQRALADAALVLDVSASVPVARWLSVVSDHIGRTVSLFLNPSGTDLVILREGMGRNPRLDHVEMAYYWLLANTSGLKSHLADGGVGIYPSGGCRDPSLRLPQSQVGALAAIAAREVFQRAQPTGGAIEIWSMTDEGICVSRAGASACTSVDLDGWTISVSDDVTRAVLAARKGAGGLETGGILVGTWDRVRRQAYVAGHYGSPPDSTSERTGFVRGETGVYKTLEAVEAATARNLTYVGEWHTHPPGHNSLPSADDQVLLRWIGDVLLFSDVPALMLIAGKDGLRVLLGRASVSALVPCKPAPDTGC